LFQKKRENKKQSDAHEKTLPADKGHDELPAPHAVFFFHG